MDNFKMYTLVFSWGVVNIFKFFLIILLIIFLIHIIERRYSCREKKKSSESEAFQKISKYGKERGRE